LLIELRVRNLGVVEDSTLELDPGMTALTGETGAGKTMVVEAIRLLTGGRAEQHVVRTGADEAVVEGRFLDGDNEVVLRRVIRRDGRSRCFVNGDMSTAAALAESGGMLVDLHGQHAHQTLLVAAAQRHALDTFGNIDTSRLDAARRRLRDIDAQLETLGGDTQARLRELDLLRFQLDELDRAGLEDAREDERLRAESERLTDASGLREAVANVADAVTSDTGIAALLAAVRKPLTGREPLQELAQLVDALAEQADEVALVSTAMLADLEDDPERLEWIQERRALLKNLQRKYGATLEDVFAFVEETRQRKDELERHDEVSAQLDVERETVLEEIRNEERRIRDKRKKVAPKLAKNVERRLNILALPNARFAVEVPDEGAGESVTFLLGPNPGMPLLPVAKAASGGELARTMLALRLALLEGSTKGQQHPPTLVFDEVDAGIGGEAAVAVGRALAELSHQTSNQVLVVTHLPQVAAFADNQVSVRKAQEDDRTASDIVLLADAEREIELARMLSGRPDSRSGRAHARELLEQAATR
jgi:DNA repair protein RecN (Recombination protein N)